MLNNQYIAKMETIKILILLSIINLLMFACSNEIDNGESSSNNLKTGQVEMKGYPNSFGKIGFIQQ